VFPYQGPSPDSRRGDVADRSLNDRPPSDVSVDRPRGDQRPPDRAMRDVGVDARDLRTDKAKKDLAKADLAKKDLAKADLAKKDLGGTDSKLSAKCMTWSNWSCPSYSSYHCNSSCDNALIVCTGASCTCVIGGSSKLCTNTSPGFCNGCQGALESHCCD
jgi:hypothetical protein